MVAWADRFDLEKQVTFYLSYHDNKINQIIHFACIWQIFISALCMFASLEAFADQPKALAWLPYSQYILLNPSCILAGVYMIWYIQLDHVAGSLGAALVFISYIFANFFVQDYAPKNFDRPGWQIALGVHCFAWIMQFIGHGVFERRKPALFDSLDQALVTAPMFVLLEALFAFGYRPELYKRVTAEAKANIKAFRATGKTL
ncbi:hypothetical protein JM18_005139 [Phytophthora kernoviae]|uniref:Uncharacterized protein n=2 Tax=Phytophthora kernoviae TaxID=325452 RepID=A0A8T0M3M5_9STRA|nr:hypothetical protein G195_005582 [Phytophthora kernoviae 00238/432]KAG2524179.1 hypothetical protein JM18_005139 [Phytophthora kernoviae]KAG2528303.1 hypothetical protein JM16_001288 [Phytophthora kernoviae]